MFYRDAQSFLIHLFGGGLDDDRYVVERYRSLADGQIRPVWAKSFRRGRDFSAWLGLVPRQHTTGGKPKLGRISKMGQRDLRRLLITGAMTVVRWAVRRGVTTDP